MFQAYASLGAGALGLIDNETVVEIAKDNNVSQAQVANKKLHLDMNVLIIYCRFYYAGVYKIDVLYFLNQAKNPGLNPTLMCGTLNCPPRI